MYVETRKFERKGLRKLSKSLSLCHKKRVE
jgi:hypothetical protein